MSTTLGFLTLLPRNLCVLVLRGYRAVISPLYGEVCRYYPSCSHYTLQAIQEHGALKGAGYGVLRIGRCHPWAAGGVDEVPRRATPRYELTPFGFVVATGSGRG